MQTTSTPYAVVSGQATAVSAAAARRNLQRRSAQFVEMMMALRGYGGFLRAPEVGAAEGNRRRRADASSETEMRRPYLIEFDWEGTNWVPLFQFEHESTKLCCRVQAVTRVLPSWLTGWDRALWFAAPNRWLNQALPVALVASEYDRVCAAAGLGRFLA